MKCWVVKLCWSHMASPSDFLSLAICPSCYHHGGLGFALTKTRCFIGRDTQLRCYFEFLFVVAEVLAGLVVSVPMVVVRQLVLFRALPFTC